MIAKKFTKKLGSKVLTYNIFIERLGLRPYCPSIYTVLVRLPLLDVWMLGHAG